MSCIYVVAMVWGVLTPANLDDLRWMDDYGVALRKCQQEGRPLLVVLQKPSDPAAFVPVASRSDEATDALLKNYTLCRVDVDTNYGRLTARAFKVAQFPHTVIIDKHGKSQLFKRTGAMSTDEFVTALATYRRGERLQVVPELSFQPVSSGAACRT